MSKKELGQYFTTDEKLQDKIIKFIKNEPKIILEPAFGKGHLLIKTLQKYDIIYHCYEIDNNLVPIINMYDKIHLFYTDFLKSTISIKYQTIIGNPPYAKTSKCNLYLSFIEKCFNLLEDRGELIFIVPSDFIKITSASKIINQMCQAGSFTDFYFPQNEKLFSEASIDVLIFRYERDLYTNICQVNDGIKNMSNINGIITFSANSNSGLIVKDLFYVLVGMVSGKESVLKNDEFGNICILNDENKINRYIFLEEFPTGNSLLDSYMQSNKEILISRKIRKFNDKNWFQFGAPRNKKNVEAHIDQPCIYIHNLTRKNDVAFKHKTMYFGASLICLIPKYEQINDYLDTIVSYFNSPIFKDNYLYSGRFKIGHKQVENILIPTDKLSHTQLH